ncbi:MATE family efflux transporter [Pedobacter sp. PWIIR3]
MRPKLKDYFFSFLSIFINVCSNILMVPLYVEYFGAINYGIWIVINTILQYLMLANFGIPTALTTIATNSSHQESIGEIFRKSLRIMASIVGLLVILISVLYLFQVIPYDFFFGKTKQTQLYASILFLTIILYLIRSPFQLSSSIFLILGKVSLSKKYEIVNNLIIPFSFLVTSLCRGNISFYAICWSLLLLVSSIIMFIHARFYLSHDFIIQNKQIKTSSVKYIQIIKVSAGYFAVSMGALLVWNTDNFVIVNFLGVNSVTSYSLTFRIFTAFFSILFTINAVLLPFYGKYNSVQDYDSIQKGLKNSILIMTLLSGPICIGIFLFSKEIFLTWTNNPRLYLGNRIFLAFGFYTFILSCVNSISTLLSAVKKIRLLIIVTFAEGVTNLILSIILIKKWGIIGVSIGTLVGSVLSFILLCIFFRRNIDIPIKIPFGIVLRNLSILTITSVSLLFTAFTNEVFVFKVVCFFIFIAVYLLTNFKDIVELLKFKNEKLA